MKATPESREDLLRRLLKIPCITASPEEDLGAQFIYKHLSALPYFQEHPQDLTLLDTPLEGDNRPLHSVIARVRPAVPSNKAVLLIGHFDVVEISMYGDVREYAFDPDGLAKHLDRTVISPEALADLESGDYIFGRGSMDMKCGLALEMELLREFSESRDLFDVNLIFAAVADEENASAGMRGVAPYLAELQEREGLEYLAVINTEPAEPGRPQAKNPVIFTGTVGKLMPAFLCIGFESHVGNYYAGLSATLLSSNVVSLAEGNPELADPEGAATPSWICLDHKILREGYSVTVPNRAAAYFNCFATSKSPAAVLQEMRSIARKAALMTVSQVEYSAAKMRGMGYAGPVTPWTIPVMTFAEVYAAATQKHGGADAVSGHVRDFLQRRSEADAAAGASSDLRDLAIAVWQEIFILSGLTGPMIIVGFLPPYYPPRRPHDRTPRHAAMLRVVDKTIAKAQKDYGLTIEQADLFMGLCDLSYFGFQGDERELAELAENMPGWEQVYSIPVQALLKLDVPVMNLSVKGWDAHKMTERLEKNFSLRILPELIYYTIAQLAEEARK